MAAPFVYALFDKQDEPAKPHAVLISHVVLKGFQAGAVLGLAVSPIYLALRKVPRKELVMRTMKSSLPVYGSVGFAVISSALLYHKYKSFGTTKEEVDDAVMDRAFRLKFHQSQNRADIFSITTALTGATIALAAKLPVLPLAASGLGAGCLIHFATSAFTVKNESWAEKKQAWKNSYEKMK